MIGFDPASFRDPSGRLFRHDGAIFRTCSAEALETLRHARNTGLLETLEHQGLIVPSELKPSRAEGLDASEVGEWLVRQPELPLVTYSYEWSFSMLRDAALTTLGALDACLAKGFVLKDATAFNVLFEGTVPRLVDVHSLERRREGALWAGYAQFCRAFLFPLFLMSYKGLDPRPLLLAGLGEIPVSEVARVIGWRDRFKPGVLVNVTMQAQLERRFADRAEDVGKAGASIKYPLEAAQNQVRKLRRIVERLRPPKGDNWTTYAETHTYRPAAFQAKESFVTRALAERRPATVLDLGTNTGQYAKLARKSGAQVIAVDVSSACVDALYRQTSGDTGLSPVVADLTKPTPPIGWRLIERKGLLDRLNGDFLLALALIHHLRITGGIPLTEVIDLLTRLAPSGVIEWVGRQDSMVRRLLALRPDVYDDYTQDNFERCLSERLSIVARESLTNGDRTLYAYRAPS
jgi:SAM-dependent methyltransferase